MADQKLSELTELATTPAVDDEIYIRDVSEAAADESKRITVANLVNAPVTTHAALTITHGAAGQILGVTTGSYAGNNAADRAITHGIGKIPAIVLISPGSLDYWIQLASGSLNGYVQWVGAAICAALYTTPMTSTYFYVGHATDYTHSGNATGTTYYWAAIG